MFCFRFPLLLRAKYDIGSFLLLTSIKFFGLFLNCCSGPEPRLNAILFIFGLDLTNCSFILPPSECQD